MNERIALLGTVEMLSALSCGLVILFVTYKLLRAYGKRKLNIDHSNTAYNIFTAGILFSVGYILSGIIKPILSSYRILSDTDISNFQLILEFLGYGGIYILIAYLLALVITMVGVYIYINMTSVNELKEMKENNIGVAVVLVAIILTLSMMCSDGIALFIESFIPYPKLPTHVG